MRLATVGYWRVSSDRQGREGVSLDDQARAGRRWCEQHGAELVKEVIEDESAWSKKGARRPAIAEAFEFIRSRPGLVKRFLVYDLSRFARNLFDQLTLQRELVALGVELQTVTLPIDDTAHGRAVAGYLGVTNQLQSDLASEKISSAFVEAMRQGRWPHVAPIGYLNARDETGRKIVIADPDRAPLVRRAFDLAAGGMAPKALTAELYRAGLRTRRGGRLSLREVRDLVANPFYCGRIVSVRHGFETVGQHQPLVDRRLWDRAQPGRRGGALRRPAHDDFPLRGFARCGACGRPLTAGWSRGHLGKRYAYFWCWAAGCRATKLPAARLVARFEERLLELGLSPGSLNLVEASLAALWRQSRAQEEAQRAAAERELAELRRRRDRLVEAFVFEKAVDRATYDRQIERLDAAIAEVHFEPGGAPADGDELGRLLAEARPLLSEPCEMWRRADAESKRRLQRLIFPKGVDVDAEELRTPETAFLFNAFGVAGAARSGKMEQNRATSNLVGLADWLREAGELARAA